MLCDLRFPASKGRKIICTILSFFILLDLINRILYDNLQSLSDFLTGLIMVQNIRIQEFTSQMQVIFTAYPGTHSARYQLLSSGNCCTREERTWTLGGALPCPPLLPPEEEPTEAGVTQPHSSSQSQDADRKKGWEGPCAGRNSTTPSPIRLPHWHGDRKGGVLWAHLRLLTLWISREAQGQSGMWVRPSHCFPCWGPYAFLVKKNNVVSIPV